MSPQAKQEYMQAILERYKEASKKEKSVILDELCQVCGYHRKWAIEKINTYNSKRRKKRPGKPTVYNHHNLLNPLKKIWIAANMPCSKRLKALIPEWLTHLDQDIDRTTHRKLLKISPASIDRLLKPMRFKLKKRGLSTTKPGSLHHKIPTKTEQWNEFRPGYIESDTVALCGSSVEGQFIVALDCVDIATGWSEQRATWGFGHAGVLEQIKDVEASLPFPILGFDSDCGKEFINHSMINYFLNRPKPVEVTRSRPYRKNDNSHIEQKNWTHIRQWLGYYRFDNKHVLPLINDLLSNELRLLNNFFLPSVKLMQKQRIGSKIIKKHDRPKTPYQRIMESKHINQKTKNELTQIKKSLNPFKLRQAIERKLNTIFKYGKSLDCPPSLS